MRICIFGAGAIGGLIGGRLALAGHEVSLIARGAHLAAMRRDGLTLVSRGEDHRVKAAATDDPAELGVQDCVVLAMKAHALPDAAARVAPLLGAETSVVTIQNGLPWWYFHRAGGAWEGRPLVSVDPDGRAWEQIGPDRIVGGVINAACTITEPGVVHHTAGGVVTVGEPDGTDSDRLGRIAAALAEAGLEGRTTDRIRDALWFKLWGNVSFSQIAVLTGATLGPLAADPGTQDLARRIMAEAEAVAGALGARLPATIDQRIAQTVDMGGHKTSILQDLEAGRPMEIDAMIGSVIEAARIAQVATPVIDMVYGLVRMRARIAGCYPENPAFEAVLAG